MADCMVQNTAGHGRIGERSATLAIGPNGHFG
jgi:hypothetical protein